MSGERNGRRILVMVCAVVHFPLPSVACTCCAGRMVPNGYGMVRNGDGVHCAWRAR